MLDFSFMFQDDLLINLVIEQMINDPDTGDYIFNLTLYLKAVYL